MVRVTQQDIAKVMGVSVMTVSNAFNRPDQLSPDLRTRVLERAAKMGYTGPDAIARQLRSGRTNTFAVAFEEKLSYAFSDPFSVAWLAAFSEVMEEHRASIMLLSVPAGDHEALAAVQDAAVDGIAGLCGNQPAMIRARERGMPTVYCTLATRADAEGKGDYVVIDDHAAALEMAGPPAPARPQADLPARRDSLPGTAPDGEYSPDGVPGTRRRPRRLPVPPTTCASSAWSRACAGLDVTIVPVGTNSRAAGQAAGTLVLDRSDRPTAVVAVSDVMALGFMDACAPARPRARRGHLGGRLRRPSGEPRTPDSPPFDNPFGTRDASPQNSCSTRADRSPDHPAARADRATQYPPCGLTSGHDNHL